MGPDADDPDQEQGAADGAGLDEKDVDQAAYYRSDPKKAIRNWFEQRGYGDPEYECDESGASRYTVNFNSCLKTQNMSRPQSAIFCKDQAAHQ
jgi:hypothetical protein